MARIQFLFPASIVLTLAVAGSTFAQGKSQDHRKSAPPSRSKLPPPGTGMGGATPLAWLDDASLVEPGNMSLALSMTRWQGTDLSEVYAPVVDVVAGLAKRLQLAASVPHVVSSSDQGGAAGGLGTTFVSGKVGIVDRHGVDSGVKMALSPTLEILGDAVLQSSPAGERRARWGLPVSFEVDRGDLRVYTSSGYFSGGVWFAGAGAGVRMNPRWSVSASVSRSWTSAETTPTVLEKPDRNEVSGGASFAVTEKVGLFASVGRTIATRDENGAGTTIGAGLSFAVARSTW